MKLPADYPEILGQLALTLFEQLQARGIDEKTAEVLAMGTAEEVRDVFGGHSLYIPKGRDMALTQRDRDMYAAYDGENIAEMCDMFGLTERACYNAIARARRERIKASQFELAL